MFDINELIKAAKITGTGLGPTLKYCASGKIPKNNRSKYLQVQKHKVMFGPSFLVNEGVLSNNSIQEYLDQYILLAARRSFSMYKLCGYTRLALDMYPDLNKRAIKYNPLLKLTDTELVFLPDEA